MSNVYARLVIYVLSTFLGTLPAIGLGWFTLAYSNGWITASLQVEGFVTMLFSGFTVSGLVFKKWGTK